MYAVYYETADLKHGGLEGHYETRNQALYKQQELEYICGLCVDIVYEPCYEIEWLKEI